jgi:antitoxin component YwqK of YwqJK toxin-antitoxin module
MKIYFRKILFYVFTALAALVVTLTISFFRYDIFTDQKIKVDRWVRLLEIENYIFHPFFKTGVVIDYYDKNKTMVKGKTYFEKRKITKRISYYINGQVWFEVPIYKSSTHGSVLYYSDNGKLQYVLNYKYGFKEGEIKEYNSNGKQIR